MTTVSTRKTRTDAAEQLLLDSDGLARFLVRVGVMPRGSSAVMTHTYASTRPTARVELTNGDQVFIKLVSEREATIARDLLAGTAAGALAPLMVRCRAFDEATGLAVYDAAVGTTWYEMLRSPAGYDQSIAAEAAASLARLHAVPVTAAATQGESAPRVKVYDHVSVAEFASAPGFHFGEFLATAQSVTAELRALRDSPYSASCVVHGDCKADNIVVLRDTRALQLVDWEHVGLGDPAHDVGTLIGSIVQVWFSGTVPGGDTLEAWMEQSDVPSSLLARLLDDLVRGYLALAGLAPDIVDRIFRYAGLFLLERGLVATSTRGRLSSVDKLLTDAGAAFLRDPLALADAFSLEEVRLRPAAR